MWTGISWICFVENVVLCDEHGSCGGLLSANRLTKFRAPASDTDSDPGDISGSQVSVSVPVAEHPVHDADLGCDVPLGVRGSVLVPVVEQSTNGGVVDDVSPGAVCGQGCKPGDMVEGEHGGGAPGAGEQAQHTQVTNGNLTPSDPDGAQCASVERNGSHHVSVVDQPRTADTQQPHIDILTAMRSSAGGTGEDEAVLSSILGGTGCVQGT